MITVKQITDQYRLVTENELTEVSNLHQLSEAGLFDGARLPMMKRAFEKNPRDMTMVEKKALVELANSLMAQILHEARPDHLSAYDKRFPKKFPSDRDIPTIIILKRKAIRVFPDNQKIALYYSQALDKYVSVPFGIKDEALGIHMSEQTKTLKKSFTEEAQVTSVSVSPRDSFKQNLQQIREEKLDEVAPIAVAGGAMALRALAASGAGAAIKSGAKKLVRKAGRALLKHGGKAAAAVAGAVAGKSKKDPDDQNNTAPERKAKPEYDFKKGGRAEPTISAPNRATADMSSIHSQRAQNRAAWRNIQTESNFDIIKTIAEDKSAQKDIVFGEKTISINNRIAKKIMKLYESLNRDNKKKTRNMLNESAESFRKIVNFAVRQDNGK